MAYVKSTRETHYNYLCRIVATRDDNWCWIWPFSLNSFGHGVVQMPNRQGTKLVHRVSFFLRHGYWPEPCGLHSQNCIYPSCFNPSHIRAGDKKSNHEDCVALGRESLPPVRRGEKHSMAKLTAEQVRQIRREYVRGVDGINRGNKAVIMAKYGVSTHTIKAICSGRLWRHVV